MGLLVEIYRCDLTTGPSRRGFSDKIKKLLLINVEGPTPDIEHPDTRAAFLVPGFVKGTARIIPAELDKNWNYIPVHGHRAMGGNYAGTSDGRFSNAVEKIIGTRFYGAVPIHDWYEG
jgi:hypothetical protein